MASRLFMVLVPAALPMLLAGPVFSRPAGDWCAHLAERAERLAGKRYASGWLVELLHPEGCQTGQGAEFIVRARLRTQLAGRGLELLLQHTLSLESGNGRRADKLAEQLQRLLVRAGKLVDWLSEQKLARRFAERYYPLAGRVLVGEEKPQVLLTGGGLTPLGKRPYLLLARGLPDAVRAYAVAGSAGLPVRRELLRLVEVVSDRHPGCRVVWVEGTALPGPSASASSADGGDGGDGGDGAVTGPCREDDEDCIPDRWQVRGALAGSDCPAAVACEVSEWLQVSRYRAWQKLEGAGWRGVPR